MSLSKENKDLCRMISPRFRTSYPHLFKPHAAKPGDKLKYALTMLYSKDESLAGLASDGVTPRTIQEVIRNAKIAEFGPDKANWPSDLESPVTDGDDPKFADKEGYKGHWVIKASTGEDQRPSVVDRNMVPITDPAEVYPGCYARAYIYAYVWFYPNRKQPMKKGIGFILDHVQKLGEGKSFGGKKPIEQVFAPLPDESGSAEASDDFDFT